MWVRKGYYLILINDMFGLCELYRFIIIKIKYCLYLFFEIEYVFIVYFCFLIVQYICEKIEIIKRFLLFLGNEIKLNFNYRIKNNES